MGLFARWWPLARSPSLSELLAAPDVGPQLPKVLASVWGRPDFSPAALPQLLAGLQRAVGHPGPSGPAPAAQALLDLLGHGGAAGAAARAHLGADVEAEAERVIQVLIRAGWWSPVRLNAHLRYPGLARAVSRAMVRQGVGPHELQQVAASPHADPGALAQVATTEALARVVASALANPALEPAVRTEVWVQMRAALARVVELYPGLAGSSYVIEEAVLQRGPAVAPGGAGPHGRLSVLTLWSELGLRPGLDEGEVLEMLAVQNPQITSALLAGPNMNRPLLDRLLRGAGITPASSGPTRGLVVQHVLRTLALSRDPDSLALVARALVEAPPAEALQWARRIPWAAMRGADLAQVLHAAPRDLRLAVLAARAAWTAPAAGREADGRPDVAAPPAGPARAR